MRGVSASAVLVLLLAGQRSVCDGGTPLEVPCVPAAIAPETMKLRDRPGVAGKVLAVLNRDGSAMVMIDGTAMAKGKDWLKVRDGSRTGWVEARYVTCRLTPEKAKSVIEADAAKVLLALSAGDMKTLSSFVHPVKGVRFSPAGDISVKSDVILQAKALEKTYASRGPRTWGSDDARGAPIRMTFRAYFKKFVIDRDWAKAPRSAYNEFALETGTGEMTWEHYPNAILADFGFPETAEIPQCSLRLAFELHQGRWYLAGIIHDGWSI